jgi:protoheme IX farnesyltransferase
MAKKTPKDISARIKEYYELTKSGLVFGNLITVIAGFLLASRGENFYWELFISTLVGIAFVMASGCVFNNYIDRDIDLLMDRTKDRGIVKKRISKKNALIFGSMLGALGFIILLLFTNILTVFLAAFGFFFYVFMYSLWFKRNSVYGAGVGAVAGAIPPVVGYCAVSNSFDMAAIILFFILLTWQMPHFFAIAIRRESDYAAAGIPVMPIEAGIKRTKISMFIYIIEFIIAASLLAVFGYAGHVYLIIVVLLGLLWLALCIKGLYVAGAVNNKAWARQMFLTSLCVMMATFITIAIGALV